MKVSNNVDLWDIRKSIAKRGKLKKVFKVITLATTDPERKIVSVFLIDRERNFYLLYTTEDMVKDIGFQIDHNYFMLVDVSQQVQMQLEGNSCSEEILGPNEKSKFVKVELVANVLKNVKILEYLGLPKEKTK